MDEEQKSAGGSAPHPGSPPESTPGEKHPVARSNRRKWAARLIGMVLVPLLFFGLLEGVLRLFGFGYATDFFISIDGHDALGSNPKFAWRFFPPALARPPLPLYLPQEKPGGAFRIFVLGGSAARGEPAPPFGFSRILEVMLEKRYPGVKFDVVNTAMTAVNSHVVLPIARECAGLDPDLFVVYLGNNEVVGPYGAGTVLQAYSPSLWAIRLGIRVKSTRIGQLVEAAVGGRGRGEASPEWRGMEMFLGHSVSADDPRLEKIYDHFRSNLAEICEWASRGETRVIACTVATNLRDCAPFASLHRPDLESPESEAWASLLREGADLQETGAHGKAVEKFLKALNLDDRHAGLHFRLALSLWETGKFEEARERFLSARDLDALRFRADTRINGIIREVTSGREPEGIFLLDAEREFEAAAETAHRVPGESLFHEHVHLNFEGNYLLASAVFREVSALLPPPIRARAVGEGDPRSRDACAARLAFTGWDRYRIAARLRSLVDRPPFTNQLDFQAKRAQWEAERRELEQEHASAEGLLKAVEAYRRAIARDPDDLPLRENYAVLLAAMRDFGAAAEQYRFLRKWIPGIAFWREGEASSHLEHGTYLRLQGKMDEALAAYRRALEIRPGFSKAHYNIGVTLAAKGNLDGAIERYRLALRAEPELAMAHNNLGFTLARQGKVEEAERAYRRALEIRPDFAMAHGNLADLLIKRGKTEEAVKHYRLSLEHNPRSAAAHGNLGDALVELGKPAEASMQYLEALRLKPKWPAILRRINDLAWSLASHPNASRRNGKEAVRLAERTCEETRYSAPEYLLTLSAALAETGSFPEAVQRAEEALDRARGAGDSDLLRNIRKHLELFRAGKPARAGK